MTATAAHDTGEGSAHALIERRGHVLIVTMNRPQARNALSAPMMALMREAWDLTDSDPGIRACVLTGAGGAFCAGADLKAMTEDRDFWRDTALKSMGHTDQALAVATGKRVAGA